jgi:hypothetical protein
LVIQLHTDLIFLLAHVLPMNATRITSTADTQNAIAVSTDSANMAEEICQVTQALGDRMGFRRQTTRPDLAEGLMLNMIATTTSASSADAEIRLIPVSKRIPPQDTPVYLSNLGPTCNPMSAKPLAAPRTP